VSAPFGSADIPLALMFILMVVGILLSNDDDLPGPRRSWAHGRSWARAHGANLPQ
jgi:hypothetical protein